MYRVTDRPSSRYRRAPSSAPPGHLPTSWAAGFRT